MQYNQQGGEIVIQLDQQGLGFTIATEQGLTFAPQLTEKKSWFRLVASTLVAVGIFSLPSLSQAATYTGADLVAETNVVRVAHGLSALTSSATLEQAATAKANDMLAKNYFGHYSPTGTAPWTFFKDAHYSFTAAGENLAADYVDGADILTAWMASKGHRDNLLNPAYHDIGIAVLDGTLNGPATTVVVQFFGSRQSTAMITVPPVAPKVAPAKVTKSVVISPATLAPTSQASPIRVEVVPSVPGPAIPVQEQVTPSSLVSVPVVSSPQVAEVKGVATQVIPSLHLNTMPTSTLNFSVGALVLATLGLYVSILTAVGLMTGLKTRPKQVLVMEFGQALV